MSDRLRAYPVRLIAGVLSLSILGACLLPHFGGRLALPIAETNTYLVMANMGCRDHHPGEHLLQTLTAYCPCGCSDPTSPASPVAPLGIGIPYTRGTAPAVPRASLVRDDATRPHNLSLDSIDPVPRRNV